MNTPRTPSRRQDTGLDKAASDTGTQSVRDAGQAIEKAKSDLADVGREAEAQMGAVAEEAKHQIGKLAEAAKGMAGEQKNLLGDQIDSVAQAFTRVAGELENESSPGAGYVRGLADTLGKLGTAMRDKDVDELASMAVDFGRRQPATFLTAAALAGFAASRFLVASSRSRTAQSAEPLGYESGMGIGDGSIAGDAGSRAGRLDTGTSPSSPRDRMGGTF